MLLRKPFWIGRLLAVLMLLTIPIGPAMAEDFVAQFFKNAGGGCDGDVGSTLTNAIRSGIEAEVKRAEAALKLPDGVSGLGCLDDLFKVNLDTFISLPNLQGLLNSAISDAKGQICNFAREQWAKVTESLTSKLKLPSFDRLGVPGFNSSQMQIQFTTPKSGFAPDGETPSYYERPDLGEGTTLREIYEKMYGGKKQ